MYQHLPESPSLSNRRLADPGIVAHPATMPGRRASKRCASLLAPPPPTQALPSGSALAWSWPPRVAAQPHGPRNPVRAPSGWRGPSPPLCLGLLPSSCCQCSTVSLPPRKPRAQGPPAFRRPTSGPNARPFAGGPAPLRAASGRSGLQGGPPPVLPRSCAAGRCSPRRGAGGSFLKSGGIMVGFTGSRSLSPRFAPLVSRVVGAVLASGQPVAVGCAAGADAFVRSAAGARARVFRASAFRQPGARWAAALVARSVALARAVAGSPSPALVGFVSIPCPAGLLPSPSPSACFCGLGSGTWATLALAAGLGVPVFAFLCGPSPSALPASWGQWLPVSSGPFAGAWQLQPAAAQPSLF